MINRKDKSIMIRMSQEDIDKLNYLCEKCNVDRCKIIRILINIVPSKTVEKKIKEYKNLL